MLLELRVHNLLLIREAELRLGAGLNVLTGETGAGKTVLAHALDLLLGGRPRTGIVRPGASEAYVEGVFELPETLLADDALGDLRERLPEDERELVLARRVGAEGRTRAFVQGRAGSADDLRELGGRLLSFYGQHEHRKLTLASAQREVLDRFLGEEHLGHCRQLARSHRRFARLTAELEELRSREATRDRDRDLLEFELAEIEALDPSEDERARLSSERERLRGLDTLRAAAGGAVEAVAPEGPEAIGAAALVAAAEREAGAGATLDPELGRLCERLTELRIEAEDLGAELRSYVAGLEAEPGRLEEVEARLELYERLERKHGGSVAAVLAHARRCRGALERIESSGAEVERLEAELERAASAQAADAERVGAARRRGAPALAKRVVAELRQLAMDDARFEVQLEPLLPIGPAGAERAELLIAPNPGVELAPLRETASGGELSRAMLALMTLASGSEDSPRTLVFDEVDAGIGGQTARAVGERLRRLAAGRQVLCITHLPQVASLAEHHFRIEKRVVGGVAEASVERLEGDGVVAELCRMLGADTADAGARRHAEELLAAA